MRDEDGLFLDPDKETQSRWENERETLGLPLSSDPPPWKIGDQLGDFVLEKLLGSGSSGFVYRVSDVKTDRRCALKLLRMGPPEDLLRNKLGFRRMMSIQHPNLLRVDRIYHIGDYIALSMEEIHGWTLRHAIVEYQQQEPSVAYDNLMQLVRDFASGLDAMHTRGCIHRDIKPENLMVDHQQRGRVIDYGLVDSFELNEATYSSRGFLFGTPRYIAPEVIWSQRYLPAGDIFGLGIVMLDVLRAIQRWQREWQRNKQDRQDDAEKIEQALGELPDSVPAILRETCREMLDRDPANRPTAMTLSRLGLPRQARVPWTLQDPLIGRHNEWQEVCQWADKIIAGGTGRLHITGPSGIGKTRIVEELARHIQSNGWCQVFSARCRARDDQPLQAFDQLCDAVANRYMQGDFGPLAVDPVSFEILRSVFPVLGSVMELSVHLPPADGDSQRLDALEAAARLCTQLRENGPLFLVIDDSQWADRDSLNVLDRLQTTDGSQGLGIITISRQADNRQRVPADRIVSLGPLPIMDATEVLRRSAKRWGIEVSNESLHQLASAAGGSPVRLQELADEFRPGGDLSHTGALVEFSVDRLGSTEQLWRRRAERLSEEAKRVLPFVVTAGGRVSTAQLAELTGLGDAVDAAVSELAQGRLIVDEATGGECISVFHDHVAEELIKTLSMDDRTRAHHAWASLLARQDEPEKHAARIAGHFFAAHQPGRAVSYAILAAENAERLLAKTEAARWYARVTEHVQGKEKVTQLRNAARCYQEADFPVKAAEYYQQLSALVDREEQIECRLMATILLIRSGRPGDARDHLNQLAQSLGLPRPKSGWRSSWARRWNQLRLASHGKQPLLTRVRSDAEQVQVRIKNSAEENACDEDSADATLCESTSIDETTQRHQRRTHLFLSLVRPMTVLDSRYAGELQAAGACQVLNQGDPHQRLWFAIAQAVSDCYDGGPTRIRGQRTLVELKALVQSEGDPKLIGDYWAALAASHMLGSRWDQVPSLVDSAVDTYRAAPQPRGFELAHTQWMELWANWNLGRWDLLSQTGLGMYYDSMRRNDLFQQILTVGGLGSAAWLIRDKPSELRRIGKKNPLVRQGHRRTEMYHLLHWIAAVEGLIYQGQYAAAWDVYQLMWSRTMRSAYRKMQLMRVMQQQIGAVIALHQLRETVIDSTRRHERSLWAKRAGRCIRRLRSEQIDWSMALARLYQGLMLFHLGASPANSVLLDQARQLVQDAQRRCRAQRLRPFQLAAEDVMAMIHTGRLTEVPAASVLARRMIVQNVVAPEKLRRLYTSC